MCVCVCMTQGEAGQVDEQGMRFLQGFIKPLCTDKGGSVLKILLGFKNTFDKVPPKETKQP